MDTGFLASRLRRGDMTLTEKLWQISWSFVFLIILLAGVGFAMLYSAANASWDPWAYRQMMRFGLGLVMMITIALIDIRYIMRYSYLIYAAVLALLLIVEVRGTIGGGAQRWIALGPFTLQPSELMKIAVVLALARYFHSVDHEDIGRPTLLVVPLLLVMVPLGLILRQPDLGTGLMMLAGAGVLFFMAGVRAWKFAVCIVAGLAAVPIGWQFLKDYQKNRVLTFLNPERDPLGAGYHIMQSKIAFGSGGVFGKGFLQGTQSHLNFLPEKQTDFIFTMLAEEFGLVGGVALIGLYILALAYMYLVAIRCRHQYGRLVAMGIAMTFFLYVFINIAMVIGIIPVVGAPLPLVSYGGTAMLALMIAFGLLLSVWVHRDVQIGRHGGFED